MVLVFLSTGMAAAKTAERITVFAAASMKTALDEIGTRFEERFGTEVVVSFGSSAAMARQIGLGAPVDVFISANGIWMDDLEKRGLIDPETRHDLVSNSLVLVTARQAIEPLDDLRDLADVLGEDRLALGQVNAVPAGIYAREALDFLGLWPGVSHQVVQADNVRAVHGFVRSGAVAFGIVYASDIASEDAVQILAHIPQQTHSPIRYPAAVVAGRQSKDAAEFINYLRSTEARTVFLRQGFAPIEDSTDKLLGQ